MTSCKKPAISALNHVNNVLKASVDRVSVDTIGRYVDRQSADVSTDTRPIRWPRLGRHIARHQPTCMSADTRPILHRHSADTWPILYRHYPPICRPTVGRYIHRYSVVFGRFRKARSALSVILTCEARIST